MATYATIARIATHPNFLARVQYAMMTAAINVAAEGAVTNHAVRLAYAQKIFAGTADMTAASFAIVTNSSILAEAVENATDNAIPDSDIQFSANSVFASLAGVG